MYNRYIPQPDGSYRRNRVQEPSHPQPAQRPQPPQPQSKPPAICPPQGGIPDEHIHNPAPKHTPSRREGSVGGFLRQLLPKDFDTGDLIIVLLLLLMAGDCEEDRSNALLTLALYFMM